RTRARHPRRPRSESVVDAAAGVGTALVDGTVAADHYVLDGTDPGGTRLPHPGPAAGAARGRRTAPAPARRTAGPRVGVRPRRHVVAAPVAAYHHAVPGASRERAAGAADLRRIRPRPGHAPAGDADGPGNAESAGGWHARVVRHDDRDRRHRRAAVRRPD